MIKHEIDMLRKATSNVVIEDLFVQVIEKGLILKVRNKNH
jgi:hypothetical protein